MREIAVRPVRWWGGLLLVGLASGCSIGGLAEERARSAAESWASSIHAPPDEKYVQYREYAARLRWDKLIKDSPTKYHGTGTLSETYVRVWNSRRVPDRMERDAQFDFERDVRNRWLMSVELGTPRPLRIMWGGWVGVSDVNKDIPVSSSGRSQAGDGMAEDHGAAGSGSNRETKATPKVDFMIPGSSAGRTRGASGNGPAPTNLTEDEARGMAAALLVRLGTHTLQQMTQPARLRQWMGLASVSPTEANGRATLDVTVPSVLRMRCFHDTTIVMTGSFLFKRSSSGWKISDLDFGNEACGLGWEQSMNQRGGGEED